MISWARTGREARIFSRHRTGIRVSNSTVEAEALAAAEQEFSDFFETLFGRGDFRGGFTRADQRPFTARGEDTYARIVVDLQDSYRGATRSVTLKHTEIGADGRPVVRTIEP